MPATVLALIEVMHPINLLLITTGVGAGIVVGALPGLTATMAIALLVPFTFGMNVVHALVLLGGIYCGAIYGGSYSAILINTPGTPAAIATTFDGFSLARKGHAYRAIVVATIASVIGGLIGVFFLIFLSPPLARASLRFGPTEFFWLTVFGLTIIATISPKSTVKGLLGGAVGLLIGTIGIAPIEGSVRFAFGTLSLQNGITLIPALIGLFCLPEILDMIESRHLSRSAIPYRSQRHMLRRVWRLMRRRPWLLIRSGLIGTLIGIIPGAGANIAGMVSYNEAVRVSREPEKFGKGAIDGITASEASNNAGVAGSLVPLLTLGIPGAPPAAVLLGALLLKGLRPGAELFTVHATVTYTFIFSLVLANIVLLPLGLLLGKAASKVVTGLPVALLAPLVFFLSVIGAFAIQNNIADVYVMLALGLVGYAGRKIGLQPGPIVLGLILGVMCEQGLVQSILIGRAAKMPMAIFFTRPISIILIGLTLLSAGWPMLARMRPPVRRTVNVNTEADDV
jgi:putative tricarboxylic transport membrane protein